MAGIVLAVLWMTAVSVTMVLVLGPVGALAVYLGAAAGTWVYLTISKPDAKFGHSFDWAVAALWPVVPLALAWDVVERYRKGG